MVLRSVYFMVKFRVMGLYSSNCTWFFWVVFLRMFWNFISSLPVKRRGSLSFLTIFTFAVPVIGLDKTENRIFTLCRMITWVVFLRMFLNFISSLPVKRGGSLSFLAGTISNVLVMEIGWTDVGRGGGYILVCAHSNTSYYWELELLSMNLNLWIPIFVKTFGENEIYWYLELLWNRPKAHFYICF
jgi:hypothetical protein